ncbi:MAG: DUF2235 domain-containing protein, partial [Rhizobiaceae bacterium]
MGRNLVILCDGTANQVGADRSNVLRLYGCLKRNDEQIVFYDPGVGTFGVRGIFKKFRSGWATIKGLALGVGIDDNVLEAYRFLVDTYESGDRIYLLGRGAYTVRLIAGFIRIYGLMRKEQLQLLEYAWRAYLRGDGEKPFAEMEHYQKVLRTKTPRIRFLGLWDTVASVFEPSPSGYWLQSRQRPYTNRNNIVETIRHAVAIDERRTMFQPSLWKPGEKYDYRPSEKQPYNSTDQDLKEVWFAGCHSDVGGGFPEQESGLAKVAMTWMLDEANKVGLLLDHDIVIKIILGEPSTDKKENYIPPNASADIHESMTPAWSILEFLPRRITPLASRVT